MNDKKNFILFLILSFTIILGITILAKSVFTSGINSNTLLWIIPGIVLIIAFLSLMLKRLYFDIKNGIPLKDERSKKVKLYAAGYAYVISTYIWLVLLIFRKHFDSDDIILIGMFGMAISFGISWLILNNKKDLV